MVFAFGNPLPRLRKVHQHNVETIRTSPLAELSGSLGDLGTLLPLMTALVVTGSISLPATLLFTGAANVFTGLAFGIPLPVQPMKAIAAVAIAKKFTLEENAAAGIVVAALVGLFSVTGLLEWANRITPVPVVKGIQVGAGLSLCISAGSKMLVPLSWTGPWWGDNLIWALAAVVLLLTTFAYPKLPYAMIVFSIGIILSLFSPHTHSQHSPSTAIPIVHPSTSDFWKATTTASLGQLPLTLLNSVIAAAALSSDLLPSPPYPPSPTVTHLGISVSVINLVSCWFGAMPICHGSGGLAAQYHFGARSGSSIILLGTAKLVLALITFVHPRPILSSLSNMPKSLLGILVLAAGIELAKVGESINTDARDLRITTPSTSNNDTLVWDGRKVRVLDEVEKRQRWEVMIVTVAAVLAAGNDGVGFLAGMGWYGGVWVAARFNEWRERREGRILLRSARQLYGERTGLLFHEESDRVA